MLFGKVIDSCLILLTSERTSHRLKKCFAGAGWTREVLSGFRQVDEKRRQLITQSETLKAQRNRASEEIAKLKKAGQDATAQMEQTKASARAE